MNKKFSTLVAALLVAGGSYSLVSAAMLAMQSAEAPVTKTAGLKAAAVPTASEAKAAVEFKTATAVADAAVWTAEEVTLQGGSKAYFLTWDGFYLAVGADGTVVLSQTQKYPFTIESYAIKCDGKFLVKAGDALKLVSTVSGEKQLAAFDNTGKGLAAFVADGKCAVAEQTADVKLVNAANLFVVNTVKAPTAVVKGATLDVDGLSAGDHSVLQISTDGIVTVAADAYLAVSDDKLIIVDSETAATAMSFGTGDKVKFGEKYLVLGGDGAVVSFSDDASAGNALVYDKASAYTKKADFTAAIDGFIAKANTGQTVELAYTAGSVAVMTAAASQNPVANLVFTGNKLKDKASGYYLSYNSTSGAILPNTSAAGAATFSVTPDGGLMTDGKLVVIDANASNAIKAIVGGGGNKTVAAYTVDGTEGTLAKTLTVDDEYALGGFIVTPANLEAGATYLSKKLTATANLLNGENYYIKAVGGSTALAMLTDDADGKNSLGTYTVTSDDEVALRANNVPTAISALWTVTKIETVGQAPRYKFTNLETGKLLAFGLNKAKTAIEFKTDGTYNAFEIEGQSLIFTVKEKDKPSLDGKMYVSVAAAGYATSETLLTFSAPKENPVISSDVADQIEYLNVTAGFGNGFGIVFNNKVNDEIKSLTVEENPFTAAELITAVSGPKDFGALYKDQTATSDLSDKMFLRVKGTYSESMKETTTDLKKAKIAAFRESEFIVADTIRYSSIIEDQSSNNFIEYTTAKGSEMMSAVGLVFDGTIASTDDAFKKDGKLQGISRRIENAQFTIDQKVGDKPGDPIFVYNSEVYVPADDNTAAGLDGHMDNVISPINNAYIAVKSFKNKYYVGAAKNTTTTPRWEYVYIGSNNDVKRTDLVGIVNIVSRNYTTDGEVYANANNNTNNTFKLGLVDAKYVSLDKPEGQYLVTATEDHKFTFTNRESGKTAFTGVGLKTIAGQPGVYHIVGAKAGLDTMEITSSVNGGTYNGYKNFDAIKDLEINTYNLKLRTNVPGVPKVFITEKHAVDHSMGMDADSLNAAQFKLIKFEAKKDDDKAQGDTVYVSTDRKYSYLKDGKYEENTDYVVAFTYAIYNADNKEFVSVKTVGNSLFYYCDPAKKYNPEEKNEVSAQKFIIKEKADGTYHLLPAQEYDEYTVGTGTDAVKVPAGTEASTFGLFNDMATVKTYSGLTEDKLSNEASIYRTTDNDLFEINPIGAPKYRTIADAPFDTIRIYKDGFDQTAMFANSEKTALEDTTFHFLGMKHNSYVKNAQYSFFVDTAYVRDNTIKPTYLLVIEPDTVHGKGICNDPTHDPHDNGRIDTVYGKFLVNLTDSIASWGTKHNNPYYWEQKAYPKLGFVDAKHIGDTLIISNSIYTGNKKQINKGDSTTFASRDTINLKDLSDITKNKIGAYAFRIVDQETKSFVMETSYDGGKTTGYIKWLNGVPVVVNTLKDAEVFNLEATSNDPVDNENIETTEVSIIAGAGQVTINNAAGKTVAISNILGQTLANTVITSDNATISVPAGVVVVAIEGEAAVKAIVK